MTDTAEGTELVTITVDGKKLQARPGELVIEAAERAGAFIPRFCYHPRMEPVGMCRMCLVEVSSPRGFSLQPACYIRVAEGQEVITDSAPAKKAQEGVLEFLLVNHPLDCPVCDKGGECPLQDQSLSHGPGESRFIEEKRHFEKPIELGPLVLLDRERCIQCARCTRFAEEIAGEAQIDFASRGDMIEVATFPGRPFSSYFSGNTVQICPVGALTSVPYRFKSRPWDLEQVETTCTACAFGCRVVAQSSQGALVRFLGVDSEPVNQSWLCDKGRYSFEAVHAANRLTAPLHRRNGELVTSNWNDALRLVADKLAAARAISPERIGVIGGARLSNEDAYAFAKLFKGVVCTDSVDAQLGDGISPTTLFALPRASIEQAASARLVITLSGDLREELPVLHLRLRAAHKAGTAILECSPVPSALSDLSTRLSYLPGEEVRLVEALTNEAVEELQGATRDELEAARKLLQSGGELGEGVVVVLGRPSLSVASATVEAAALRLARALPGAKFLPALRRSNVFGALQMGLSPGLLPGEVPLAAAKDAFEAVWGAVPEQTGRDATQILSAAANGEVSVLVLLGADPLSDFPDHDLAQRAISGAQFVVYLGTHAEGSSEHADVVLPLTGDHERSGSTTNIEGRVTCLAQKVVPPGIAWAPWVVASELARRLAGDDLGFANIETITDEIATVVKSHRGLYARVLHEERHKDGVLTPMRETPVTIGAPRRIDPIATPGIASVDRQGAPLRVGLAVPLGGEPVEEEVNLNSKLDQAALEPREEKVEVPRLDAYSHRLVVSRRLFDRSTMVSSSPSFEPLVESQVVRVHPAELERLGTAPGGRIRLRSARGALELVAKPDESLPRQVVAVEFNLGTDPSSSAQSLIDAGAVVTDVRLESTDA